MTTPLVAHIINRLDVGGLENGLVNLINGLNPSRCRHAVICMIDYTSFRDRIRRADVDVIALHKQPGKDPATYWRLFRLLRELQPAIVHSRNAGTLDCIAVAWAAGVRLRVHGWHGWTSDDVRGTDRSKRFLRRVIDPLVTRYVAVSADLATWLENDLGVRRKRLQLIVNGVDTERFRPIDSPRAGLGGHAVTIGYVGRLDPIKNPGLIVDAVASLIAGDDGLRHRLRVVLVGDGSMRQDLQRQIDRHGLTGCISLPGTSDDVAREMQAMDLFVLPSLNEGISNTILEAMACGLPVVATRVGGNPELVVDGITGVLTKPGCAEDLARALHRYLSDPSQLARHGRAARQRAEELFSLSAMLRRYDNLYASLLGTRDRGQS
jgi:sugar transferase (PEP-CTERM/EpsH1 system associated)